MYWQKFRVKPGSRVRLSEHDPADTDGFHGEPEAEELQRRLAEQLAEHQDRLYADDRFSLLLIFQAMDAAGKDGTIKHVMSGVNPMGCNVVSFKAPSHEELEHDFLWRCVKVLPERGHIGIFNRSYYEELLVVRVHQQFLAGQRLPPWGPDGDSLWKKRFDHIRHFENYLYEQGTLVLKFFLHVSKAEQKRRFLDRINEPEKNWKFRVEDVEERQHWDEYMRAYEDMLGETSSEHAPWYVIPADHKWYMRLTVAHVIDALLDGLDLKYPQVGPEERARLLEAKARLEAE